MRERTLIRDAAAKVGETVTLSGWITVRRDHGKLVFFELRDRSGSVQLVVTPEKADVIEAAKEIRAEYAVTVDGLVKERPAKKGAAETISSADRIEIEVTVLAVAARPSEELAIDVSKSDLDLNLDTLLNHRTLTLRNEKVRAIFTITSELLRAYSETLHAAGFVEIKTPKILSTATEGGANFFKLKYFDRDAYLAQSPQFYKQAALGPGRHRDRST
jgi:nondiscriminating aspartyl-tRNA synthetase